MLFRIECGVAAFYVCPRILCVFIENNSDKDDLFVAYRAMIRTYRFMQYRYVKSGVPLGFLGPLANLFSGLRNLNHTGKYGVLLGPLFDQDPLNRPNLPPVKAAFCEVPVAHGQRRSKLSLMTASCWLSYQNATFNVTKLY